MKLKSALFYLRLNLLVWGFGSLTVADPVIQFAELDLTSAPRKVYTIDLEKEIESALYWRNKSVAQSKLEDLARMYVEGHKIQEAIWALKKSGNEQEARDLENILRDFLETSIPIEIHRNSIGVERSETVLLAGGIKGIFKKAGEEVMGNIGTEVFAYEVSRRTGIDLVPMTIWRTVNRKVGSFQVFISESRVGGKDLRYVNRYSKGLEKLYLLDYLLENKDRNETNYLFYGFKNLIAIDHGLTYRPISDYDYTSYPTPPILESDFKASHFPKELPIEALNSPSFEELMSCCSQYVHSKIIERFHIRRNEVIKKVNGRFNLLSLFHLKN